jgi:hypothetical protein
MHTTFDSMQGAEEPGRKRLSFFGSGAVTRCSLARLDYAVGHAIIVAVFYSAPLPVRPPPARTHTHPYARRP